MNPGNSVRFACIVTSITPKPPISSECDMNSTSSKQLIPLHNVLIECLKPCHLSLKSEIGLTLVLT